MKIEILGTGCPKCKQLEALVKEAVTELKIKANIVKITDIEEIIEYGIMSLPALFINGKEILSGRLPGKEELKKLIK